MTQINEQFGLPKSARNTDQINRLFEALRSQVGKWYRNAYGASEPYDEMIKCYSQGTISRIHALLSSTKIYKENITPQKILDTGCGFGSIAVLLAHIWPNANVLAIDHTDHYYQCGLAVAREMKISNVQFLKMPIEKMKLSESFELVICCNMLNFLNSKDLLEKGLSNIANAISSDGLVVIHTPHFWSFREPFTKIPFLHYLPHAWQDFVVRKAGKRSLLSDTRNPSLQEISRILRSKGVLLQTCSPKWPLSRLRSTHLTASFSRIHQSR